MWIQSSPKVNLSKLKMQSFGKMQIIAQPTARIHPDNIQARSTKGQRRKEAEAPEGRTQDDQGRDPSGNEGLAAHAFIGLHETSAGLAGWVVRVVCGASAVQGLDVEDEFDQGASNER